MRSRNLKTIGIMAAATIALAGCGTTAGTGSAESASGESGRDSSVGEIVEYEPTDVVVPKDGKKLKIGVTFPILDQFLQNVADGMQERADAAGVELVVVTAQEKVDTQLGQVENFISQGVDGIIIIPVDTDAAEPMTTAAQNADIPVAYVNRRPSELPEGVPYVGSDSLFAGQIEMEALGEMADWKGNVAILIGDPANEGAQLRTEGCKEIIDAHEGLTLIREQAGNWYRDKGLSITENWIQSGDDINIICSNNDEMALGAIQALSKAGILDDVLVGGVDATPDALAAMADGELNVTVFQDAFGQGSGGVDMIVAMNNGDPVPSILDVPFQLVTSENMDEFVGRN